MMISKDLLVKKRSSNRRQVCIIAERVMAEYASRDASSQ